MAFIKEESEDLRIEETFTVKPEETEEQTARKRKASPVWERFEMVAHNKVKCLLCLKELTYNNNTSSMLRHYRALHEHGETYNPHSTQISKKEMVNEALVNMVVKDSQPFSIVEDAGFRELLHVMDPTYVIPTRKALKVMVDNKYMEAKEKAREQLQKVESVSLASDMWTSLNMDAYLAVTCHFIDENDKLCTILLGVEHLPKSYTAENLATGHIKLMEEWGIKEKVTCLVTDATANMIACVKSLNVRHAICIAHALNLIVTKCFDDISSFNDIRLKCRKLVTYFRTSTTAKERLAQVQEQMGRPVLKLISEVDTRWNSTYNMLERLYQLREPVGAALACLRTDITSPTALEYEAIQDALHVLAPFHQATVELSAEKRVSASKVIPLMKMLNHAVTSKLEGLRSNLTRQLGDSLLRRVKENAVHLESLSVMTIPTLLDPRFKKLGFLSQGKLQEAVSRLKSECATVIISSGVHSTSTNTPPAQLPDSSEAGQSTNNSDLWHLLDSTVDHSRRSSNAAADATVEVDRYLSEVNLSRSEDPLVYWAQQKHLYPHLYQLALAFLCSPASSVPCERIFSKAGEVLSMKRNRLNPNTLQKILFLNKNEL